MVNEINKSTNDNSALSERLAASNRQLQEMQEEHRQLLLEMQTLRQRATELSRLSNLQQEQQQQRQQPATIDPPQQQQPQEQGIEANKETSPARVPDPEPVSPTTTINLPKEKPQKSIDETDKLEAEDGADDADTAAYLQEKLAEMARLKSQFKRVQNLIDTTHLIEQHVAAKEEQSEKSKSDEPHVSTTTANFATSTQACAMPVVTSPSVTPADGNVHTENEELLGTMLNMFTDFTADLRGQAESLRAERDRIKALRDEILKRRQQ